MRDTFMKMKRANKHCTGSAKKKQILMVVVGQANFLDNVSFQRRQIFFTHNMSSKI